MELQLQTVKQQQEDEKIQLKQVSNSLTNRVYRPLSLNKPTLAFLYFSLSFLFSHSTSLSESLFPCFSVITLPLLSFSLSHPPTSTICSHPPSPFFFPSVPPYLSTSCAFCLMRQKPTNCTYEYNRHVTQILKSHITTISAMFICTH